MEEHYSAPWSTSLKLITAGVVALLIFVSYQLGTYGRLGIWTFIAVCAAFTVRGYSIADETILVHRLGWASRIDLSSIKKADYTPGAMSGSIRTFGNGGLFGFTGYYRNATLGSYRAYATHTANTVVLETADQNIVLTPDSPAEFAASVNAKLGRP